MLTVEATELTEREARRRESEEWINYLEGVIERNRPAFEQEQAELLAARVIDKQGNLLIKELPPDMRPDSGSDVGG
jgi:hypothetical protein